jgi:hypothetical protein
LKRTNRNISFPWPKRCVLDKWPGNYKNAILVLLIQLIHFNFIFLFHLPWPTYINHKWFNFNPNLMGFFALASSWSLLFYHNFSRILWSMVFDWY